MNMKNIQTGTIVRTIVLLFALVNQILSISGRNILPFTEDEVCEIVTTIITVISAVWTWWKNNSFTQEAIEADEKLEELKHTM